MNEATRMLAATSRQGIFEAGAEAPALRDFFAEVLMEGDEVLFEKDSAQNLERAFGRRKSELGMRLGLGEVSGLTGGREMGSGFESPSPLHRNQNLD